MFRTSATLRVGLATLAVCSVAVIGATAFATTHLTTAAASCLHPHGGGPGYDASIGNAQNGATVCISVGEKLLVFLGSSSDAGSPWSAVRVSKPGILTVAPLTLMLVRGVTATNFRAVRAGTVDLSSQRRACAPEPSGAPVCDAIEVWQATLVVQTRAVSPGIYGTVTAGPTCPVQHVGQSCPPRPVTAVVELRDDRGVTVSSTETTKTGDYVLAGRPGKYVLVVDTKSVFPRCPSQPVIIRVGDRQRIDIRCDTGIR